MVGQSPSIYQGTFKGQSPRSDKGNTVRPTETICWVDQRVEFAGRLVEKEKGAVNPNFTYLQNSGTLMVEEGGCQEKLPTQKLGQSKDNIPYRGLRREERRMLRKAKGSQIEKNQSYSCVLDRDPTSGKVMRETLFSVDLGVRGGRR